MQALAHDPWMAGYVGINVPRVLTWTVVAAFLLAGFAGGLLLPNQVLSPGLSHAFLLQSFVVVIIGGLGNIRGAFVAALLLGSIVSVILNERGASYVQDLQVTLEALVRTHRSRTHFGAEGDKGIFVLRSDLIPAETRALLLAVAPENADGLAPHVDDVDILIGVERDTGGHADVSQLGEFLGLEIEHEHRLLHHVGDVQAIAVIGDRESRWFDDIATVDKRETRDEIFLLAAADAEEHREHARGNAHRLVDEARVEVHVRIELPRHEVVVGQRDEIGPTRQRAR